MVVLKGRLEEAVGVLAWDPIVESRARLGGEVGEEEEEVEEEGEGGSICMLLP